MYTPCRYTRDTLAFCMHVSSRRLYSARIACSQIQLSPLIMIMIIIIIQGWGWEACTPVQLHTNKIIYTYSCMYNNYIKHKSEIIKIIVYSWFDNDYDLIQGKGNACKPAQYIVTLLLYLKLFNGRICYNIICEIVPVINYPSTKIVDAINYTSYSWKFQIIRTPFPAVVANRPI